MWRRLALWTLVLGAFGTGLLLGGQITSALAGTGQQLDAALAPVQEAWEIIQGQFIDPPEPEALVEATLNGLMAALNDPYSLYMDPETFQMTNSDLEGEFEGIGATVQLDEETGALVIMSTLPDSPAEAAGLRRGDAIVRVDGVDVTGMPQSKIIGAIRGPEGTTVELGILRPGETELLIVPIVRARIVLVMVAGKILDGDIAYIRLFQFGEDTADQLRAQLQTLDAENRTGLILDLRGNPGGFLTSAVDVASEFLPEGVILTERLRDHEQVYRASGVASAPTVPMIVLVDEGSASGAELVAAALQDHERATIVGTRTFGKGTVQTWRELSNGGGIRVTIARWYTPAGRTIHEVGVLPDVVVEQDADAPESDSQLQAAIGLLRQGIPALP